MATLTAYVAVNFINPSIMYGDVFEATSTRIVISDYSVIGIYTGVGFKYANDEATGGTVTGFGMYSYYDYAPLFVVTNGKLNAKKLSDLLDTGLADQVYGYAFGKNDTFNGSAFADQLRGHNGNDVLYGNGGDDILVGDAGKDTLVGGAGSDAFGFTGKAGTKNLDTVVDFKSGEDGLLFDATFFTQLAPYSDLTNHFVIGAKAVDANDYLVFNPLTSTLYYDADGSGKGKAQAVVKLLGVTTLDAAEDLLAVVA